MEENSGKKKVVKKQEYYLDIVESTGEEKLYFN